MPNGAKTVLDCSDQSSQAGGRRPATQDVVWSEIAGDCNLGLGCHKLDTSTPVCHWYNVHYSCVCLGGGITKFTQIAWHKVTSDVCIVPWDWQSGSSTQMWPVFSFSSKLRWEWLIPVRYLTATQLLEKNLEANNHRREESQRIIKSSDDAGDVAFSGSQLTW